MGLVPDLLHLYSSSAYFPDLMEAQLFSYDVCSPEVFNVNKMHFFGQPKTNETFPPLQIFKCFIILNLFVDVYLGFLKQSYVRCDNHVLLNFFQKLDIFGQKCEFKDVSDENF